MRTVMLLALASNFETSTIRAIDGWLTDHGLGMQVEDVAMVQEVEKDSYWANKYNKAKKIEDVKGKKKKKTDNA